MDHHNASICHYISYASISLHDAHMLDHHVCVYGNDNNPFYYDNDNACEKALEALDDVYGLYKIYVPCEQKQDHQQATKHLQIRLGISLFLSVGNCVLILNFTP